jgi:hypothetical protein
MKTIFFLQKNNNQYLFKKKIKHNLILNTQLKNQIFLNKNNSNYSYLQKKNDLLTTFSILSDSNTSREKNSLQSINLNFPTIITSKLRNEKNNYNRKQNNNKSILKRNFSSHNSSIEKYIISAYSLTNKIKVLPIKLNKPKLLQDTFEDKIKKFNEKMNKNLKMRKSYTNPKKFNKLPSKINLNNFDEEKKDQINNYNLEDYYLHKSILLALKNFNSPYPKYEKIFFYDSFENKINFLFDSVFYPHFENTLMWKKINFEEKKVMNKELCNLNLFTKEISLALNMKRALLFNPNNNLKYKRINDDDKENEIKNKKENIKNLKRKYDIIDFFEKKFERREITFANNKDKKICLSKIFNSGKFLRNFKKVYNN